MNPLLLAALAAAVGWSRATKRKRFQAAALWGVAGYVVLPPLLARVQTLRLPEVAVG